MVRRVSFPLLRLCCCHGDPAQYRGSAALTVGGCAWPRSPWGGASICGLSLEPLSQSPAQAERLGRASETWPRIAGPRRPLQRAIMPPGPALRGDQGPVVGKGAAPSPFPENLLVTHSYPTCFWVGVVYVAEQLPGCGLLKVTRTQGLSLSLRPLSFPGGQALRPREGRRGREAVNRRHGRPRPRRGVWCRFLPSFCEPALWIVTSSPEPRGGLRDPGWDREGGGQRMRPLF